MRGSAGAPTDCPRGERTRKRRRHLHLRRRPPDRLGGALSRHEWPAPSYRLVLARLKGECHGAGHWPSNPLPPPPRALAFPPPLIPPTSCPSSPPSPTQPPPQ